MVQQFKQVSQGPVTYNLLDVDLRTAKNTQQSKQVSAPKPAAPTPTQPKPVTKGGKGGGGNSGPPGGGSSKGATQGGPFDRVAAAQTAERIAKSTVSVSTPVGTISQATDLVGIGLAAASLTPGPIGLGAGVINTARNLAREKERKDAINAASKAAAALGQSPNPADVASGLSLSGPTSNISTGALTGAFDPAAEKTPGSSIGGNGGNNKGGSSKGPNRSRGVDAPNRF